MTLKAEIPHAPPLDSDMAQERSTRQGDDDRPARGATQKERSEGWSQAESWGLK